MNSVITEITDTRKSTAFLSLERRVLVLAAQSAFKWGVAVLFPGLTIFLSRELPPWFWMWVIALALLRVEKWLTAIDLAVSGTSARASAFFAYLLAWPGMDARRFLKSGSVVRPRFAEWMRAASKTLFGAALIWVIAPAIHTST